MEKLAFLYPGQGAQTAGMGKDFYENSVLAREVYDNANEVLDFDIKAMCFEENERLDQTEYTQAAMVTTSLAMTEVLMAEGVTPDMTAGLSLGEYCAISIAGGMKATDAIRLVRTRGKLMQDAVPLGEGVMCAVTKIDAAVIEELIRPIDGVTIANYNCPGQIVITGKKVAVETAMEALKNAGTRRCIMLNVSGPFHSPMMIPAGEILAAELKKTELSELKIPYVANVTADIVRDVKDTKDLLIRQISSPVKWMQSMERMIAEGVDTFIEIGPGKTLASFMKKINLNVTFFNISEWEDVEVVVSKLIEDKKI